MTTFRELVQLVKDENLPKESLEKYRDAIINVVADMQMETADLEKERALFMGAKTVEQSVADREVQWKASERGQRLIEVKNFLTTGKILIRGLQNRVYSKL